ncbi:HAD family hydrolase [Barrientosiimonas endolithica]|uniref:Hydrolase n=1 Tax=Barrientosiimonas endolithica TaxID=1535208 RepID=A0ABM8HAE9_9MICO|nr:hypothetical protein GCM10025872_15580 [Barrientosiimonas endolithica]
MLWDMDGTLVDTEPFWIGAERALVESYGGTWSDELAHRCVGNPLLVSATIIRDNSPVELTPEQIVDHLLGLVVAEMRRHVPWRPGARELLESLVAEGIPCALVTMSYVRFAQVLLDVLPAGTFATVVTGDAVTHGKPHPEPYLTAAERLGSTRATASRWRTRRRAYARPSPPACPPSRSRTWCRCRRWPGRCRSRRWTG